MVESILDIPIKRLNLINEIEDIIVKKMNDEGVGIYSFINEKEKLTVITDDNINEVIVALHFNGETLGVMFESSLTPMRRAFLESASIVPFGKEYDEWFTKLQDEQEDAFDGFVLLRECLQYPTDSMYSILKYIVTSL